MIISNNQIRNLLAMYLKQDKKVSPEQPDEAAKNLNKEVFRKEEAENKKVYSQAKEVIKDLPDIREDRTAMIQKQVRTGTYEITEEEVAEKMIGRSLVDELV